MDRRDSDDNEQVRDRLLEQAESAGRLWMAANQAKDGRISELEREVVQLRRTVVRLAELAGRRRRLRLAPRSSAAEPTHESPRPVGGRA